MSDNSGSRRGRRQPDYARSSPSAAHAARQRNAQNLDSRPVSFASADGGGPGDGLLMPSNASLRSMESRFSLRDTFAASRREFEFEADDEDDMLEPAPVISDLPGIPSAGDETRDEITEEEDFSDIDDTEIQRLLYATDYDSFDYYTLLGLSRNPPPTTSQIRAAYHRLSLAFHPDKHPQSMKAAAERYFTRLQKAYETLIHPQKKVIYDLEGDEGLRMEYNVGGAMGKGGAAEMQIGIKTMESAEFKRWFISVLKERERRAIRELTGSTGTVKLSLNATGVFDEASRIEVFRIPNDNHAPPITVVKPPVELTGLKMLQSFAVPLKGLGSLIQTPVPTSEELSQKESNGEDFGLKKDWTDAVYQSVPKLTVTGGVSGELDTKLAVFAPDQNQLGPVPSPVSWHGLSTESIQLSTGVEHSFPEIANARTPKRTVSSFMAGTDVDASMDLLPKRTFNVGLGRSFTLLGDTRPFYGHVRTSFNESVFTKPPTLDARISRSFGGNHTGYLSWGSGDFPWPSYLQSIPLWLPRGRVMPTMRLGYLYVADGGKIIGADEDRDPFLNETRDETTAKKEVSANPSWHISSMATPYNASVSVIYGRDIFNRITESDILSRITNSGEAVSKSNPAKMASTRGVRLEIEAEVSMDMALAGTVRGVRRIGDFSSVGVGVGLQQRGLFVSFSWSRLGQNIIIPVILVPHGEITTNALFYALAIPWATYAAVEFVIIRPRLRQKRSRLVEKKRRELNENVLKQKMEAEQAVLLMQPSVESRQLLELEEGGLVVLKATWGVPDAGKHEKVQFKAGEFADVTTALASLVHDGQLIIPRGLNKAQLIGFWDASPLKAKVLAVDYLFGGKPHRVEVRGKSALSIPKREHEV